jgi:hypothetical protein
MLNMDRIPLPVAITAFAWALIIAKFIGLL